VEQEQIAAAVAVEREALAGLLETLTPEQLETPSLCHGWSVHHVAAHLTFLWSISTPGFVWRVLRARGSFPRAVDVLTRELVRTPIHEIAASMRANAHNTKHPPIGLIAPLTDVIVHGYDIRRPLGVRREVPKDAVQASLEFVTSGRDRGTFLPRKRLQGLRLVAKDIEWSWGDGAEITGPGQSLLCAAMGRRPALEELDGAVPVLDARL